MFLNKVKDFLIKKNVKKRLSNVTLFASNNYIKSVGIILDESYFYDKQKLIDELVLKGIDRNAIQFIVFKDKIKKEETFDYITFSHKNLSWNATFNSDEVNKFIQFPFDLLISYYDTEKAALLLATHYSKSSFKVGFANIDNRLNHFMINTQAENYKVFVDELFKYLKILNKI
jgi:hypothetical protein